MATPLAQGGLHAPPEAARPRRRAGAGGSSAAPLAARAALRGRLFLVPGSAAARLAAGAGGCGAGSGVRAGARSAGGATCAAARADSGAQPSDKERAKAEKAAAAAAAKAEKAAAAAAAKEAKAAAAAVAKAERAAAAAAKKEALAAERAVKREATKQKNTAVKLLTRRTRAEERAADAAERERLGKRNAGFSPQERLKNMQLAEAQERRAARRAAEQALAARAERAALADGTLLADADAAAADLEEEEEEEEEETVEIDETDEDFEAASEGAKKAAELKAAVAAAAAAASVKQIGAAVKLTTKKRVIEAAPEVLLAKDAEPTPKRWYTVTTRWGGEHLTEPKVASVLSAAAAREGFTYMLITPRAATDADWTRNQKPPLPTIRAGRELDAPGWPQNRGKSLAPGQLLLRAPLSAETCHELRSTGVMLAGAGKAIFGLQVDDTPPTPMSLNVLEKIRVAINAPPSADADDDAAGDDEEDADADADADDWDERAAAAAAAADLAAMEQDELGDDSGDGSDVPKDPVLEARLAEARLQRSVSAIADAAARGRAMARGVPAPPPPLAEQVSAYRDALEPREAPAYAMGELLKDFRSDLAKAQTF